MSAIIGPHIAGSISEHLNLLARWQPRLSWWLDPDKDGAIEYHKRCRGKLGGRIYVPDDEMTWRIESDPLAAANFAHTKIITHPACYQIDYWQIENEVCQFWHQLGRLNDYVCERMRLANQAGYHCGIIATSVGNLHMPEDDRMAYYRQLYSAFDMAIAGQHVVVKHLYGAPDLYGPWERGGAPWFINRLEEQLLPRLPEKYRNLQFAIAEYGIDYLLIQSTPQGWRGKMSADDYALSLIQMGQWLEQFSKQVVGYCVYELGCVDEANWGTYNIAGSVAERLADYYSSSNQTPPLPPVPAPEENMTRIIDTNGAEHDEAWLTSKYGAIITRVSSSGKRFTLSEVQVTEGPATLIAIVKDSSGVPLNSHAVALYWPDAPTDLTTPETAVFKTRFKPRANVQWTDTNGMTGYGLGMGSYIYEVATGGPHAVWLLHNLYESDAIDRVGMLAGTNHVGPLRLTFTLTEKTQEIGQLPESEPIAPVAILADKVRWWMEESVRQDEIGNNAYAKAIRYSLIKRDGGLLYRLEAALKGGMGSN